MNKAKICVTQGTPPNTYKYIYGVNIKMNNKYGN